MIPFNALDFSEWHSEEVISFFWRSVYNVVRHVGLHVVVTDSSLTLEFAVNYDVASNNTNIKCLLLYKAWKLDHAQISCKHIDKHIL